MRQPSGVTARQERIAKTHADFIVEELPEPGDVFTIRELPDGDWVAARKRKLQTFDAVMIADRSPGHSDEPHTYQVASWAWDLAVEMAENRDHLCPCGHSGIHNRGDFYECRYPGCDERFSRAEVTA
jgi:hypothetical protein